MLSFIFSIKLIGICYLIICQRFFEKKNISDFQKLGVKSIIQIFLMNLFSISIMQPKPSGFFRSELSDGSARPMIPAQCFPAWFPHADMSRTGVVHIDSSGKYVCFLFSFSFSSLFLSFFFSFFLLYFLYFSLLPVYFLLFLFLFYFLGTFFSLFCFSFRFFSFSFFSYFLFIASTYFSFLFHYFLIIFYFIFSIFFCILFVWCDLSLFSLLSLGFLHIFFCWFYLT